LAGHTRLDGSPRTVIRSSQLLFNPPVMLLLQYPQPDLALN
jgi:hypothetical protein